MMISELAPIDFWTRAYALACVNLMKYGLTPTSLISGTIEAAKYVKECTNGGIGDANGSADSGVKRHETTTH